MPPPSFELLDVRVEAVEADLAKFRAEFDDGPHGDFGLRTKVNLLWHAKNGLFLLAGTVFGVLLSKVFGL